MKGDIGAISGSAPLRRNPIGIMWKIVMIALLALAVFLYGSVPLRSPWRSGGFAVLLSVIVALRVFGLPPKSVALQFNRYRDVAAIAGFLFLSLVLDSSGTLLAGFVGAAVVTGASGIFLARMAVHTFRQLQEIQGLGTGMTREPRGTALFAHATDVHVTAADDMGRLQGDPGGLETLLKLFASGRTSQYGYVVLSGDITDTGDLVEWRRFEEAVGRLSGGVRLVIAAGNHDLSPKYGISTSSKLYRYLEAQSRCLAEFRTPSGRDLCETLTQATAEILPLVQRRAHFKWMQALLHPRWERPRNGCAAQGLEGL